MQDPIFNVQTWPRVRRTIDFWSGSRADEPSPWLAAPDYSRSTPSSGPSQWFLREWRCVPGH